MTLMYWLQIRREAPKTWKKCLAKPTSAAAAEDELKADVTFVRNNEDQAVIEQEELIMSFKYGSELVAVSDEDKQNFTYESGPKNFSVIGFVARSEIHHHYLLGDGCMVFQPVEEDEHSTAALSAVSYALHDLDMVAVVRRVYRNNSCPRLGVLVPEYAADEDGLSHMVTH